MPLIFGQGQIALMRGRAVNRRCNRYLSHHIRGHRPDLRRQHVLGLCPGIATDRGGQWVARHHTVGARAHTMLGSRPTEWGHRRHRHGGRTNGGRNLITGMHGLPPRRIPDNLNGGYKLIPIFYRAVARERSMLILVTGGARSGKSRYAQDLALSLTPNPVYVATARNWGGDFGDRIAQHQAERGPDWTNFETEKNVSTLPIRDRVVVIDCVTLWLTNYFLDLGEAIAPSLEAFQAEIDAIAPLPGTFILVTNELGMGIHPENAMARRFTDLQGYANQYIAARAQQVTFLVSGIPMQIKSTTE
jgi:adenosylcobinamide kinase / adenosylcobinamide-phosphate guanylyltransferase